MIQLTLEEFKKALKEGLDSGFENQAQFINNAFQEQPNHFESLINDLREDLKGDITRIETKLDRALYFVYRISSLGIAS